MTYVMNIAADSLNNNRSKYYTVEVITFDGECIILEIEACNADEAMELAASQVDGADYAMVQGCFVGW